MTTDQVLTKLRRLLEEVDQSTSSLTDEELLATLGDERDVLELAGVVGFVDLAVGTDVTDAATYGIIPTTVGGLTLELGTILAYKAAAALLRRQFRGRLMRGEIGVSWSSGLESESTIGAARDYKQAIDQIALEAESLVLIKRAPTVSTRPQ